MILMASLLAVLLIRYSARPGVGAIAQRAQARVD
jgi:hypothetical protein